MQTALKSQTELTDKETYYEILKVPRSATITEIVNAYHTAKGAFSKDSVATYSLFTPEDTKLILEKLEEAYLTLSNIEKKREYDRRLAQEEGHGAARSESPEKKPAEMSASVTEITKNRPSTHEVRTSTMNSDLTQTAATAPTAPLAALDSSEATDPDLNVDAAIRLNGALLQQIRERRGLSLDDVSRITKIPMKFLRALEGQDMKNLPARVYIQGFLKNLASLYKLDPKVAVKAYLEALDAPANTNPSEH